MRTINLPVSLKDKSNVRLEAEFNCHIINRGNAWILVEDRG